MRLNACWLLAVVLLAAAGLLLGSVEVGAHAHLRSSNPAEGAVVSELPDVVKLEFSMAVEPMFSTFKVYPLEPAENETALRGAASRLVGEVLQRSGDDERRADAGLASGGSRTDRIEIRLQDDLEPGPYVVMWRVLAIDTHVTEGFFVFTYEP